MRKAQTTAVPLHRELLLVGGGHTHALVLRMWAIDPLPGVRVSVINPQPTAPYSGMLPGFVAGHYRREELDIDLVRLARAADARIVIGRAVGIDPQARRVQLEDGRELPYDVVSIDIGITSEMESLKGFAEHAVPAKPLERFAREWDGFRDRAGRERTPARAAVIGGGLAGVELALAMAHALGAPEGRISLIERADILPELRPRVRNFLRRALADKGVELIERDPPSAVTAEGIRLASGRFVESRFTVGAAGAWAQPWLRDSGLTLDAGGFIAVDARLRALGRADVFAAGDCAHMSHAPRPKAGVYAVRQAPVLLHNLRAALAGGRMRSFRPQRDYLKLVSLGTRTALADKWGLLWHGRAAWRLKDRIDRRFMARFHDLPPMHPAPAARVALPDPGEERDADRPLCGGCGAKVSGTALAASLAGLPRPAREDVLSGPGDDAAVLRGPGGARQVISTDHLRGFIGDEALMARIAAVHALGDIWAMGARPQAALASITLPRMSARLQRRWLEAIMQAAGEVLAAAGAAIVGGHSAQGAELAIGFTVTGLCDGTPIGKRGARPGDLLILTRPLGSGTIMAADMALEARGAWVLEALETMARPQQDAARLLRPLARAMTDVTGFGLAGHAREIASASGVEITIEADALRFLPGALELAGQGVRSSLFADNRALVPEIDPGNDPHAQLLFDPQTAGGLLAAVPAAACEELLRRIGALGHPAHVVGRCAKGPPRLRLA